MTQVSMQWDGTTVGDAATLSPYGHDEVAAWFQTGLAYDRATQGVMRRDDSVIINSVTYDLSSLLAVTNPTGYTLRVASGGAVVDGVPFYNSANVDFTTTDDSSAITAPGSGTNYYRVVARKDWSAQTIRLAVLDVSAVAPAAVTQTQGTTWEISLATVSITSGGVVTVTDTRVWCGPYVSTNNLVDDAVTNAKIADDAVDTDQIADDAVTNAKIRESAALSVIGNATNATANPTDIAAGSDAYVLRRSGTALAFGQVATGGIADDAVTNAKIRESAALSVIGNATNAAANPTDIAAGSDAYVLQRSGTALAFGQVATGGIANGAVTNAKIRDSSALAVIGNATNAPATPGDIAAGTDHYVLRRSGTALAFGQVATGGIADDAVDDTKAGNRVARLIRRQGGGATDWDTAGTTTYTPTTTIMQCGAVEVTVTNGNSTGQTTVTYPVAFGANPIVFVTWAGTRAVTCGYQANAGSEESTFNAAVTRSGTSGDETFTVFWLAMGQEA